MQAWTAHPPVTVSAIALFVAVDRHHATRPDVEYILCNRQSSSVTAVVRVIV